MPLLRSSTKHSPPPSTKGSRSRRSVSPAPEKQRSGGFFGHRRGSSSDSSLSDTRSNSVRSGATGSGGGFFGRFHNNDVDHDPSILAAREKVSSAERAEKDADRALDQARQRVREARDHVKILEQEAHDDALRAKAKQAEAKTVGKLARGLGRHG